MKRFKTFFSILLSFVIIIGSLAISGEEHEISEDVFLISENDSNSYIANTSDTIIHAATGDIYESVDAFYESVGNTAKQNDPELKYYVKENLETGTRYIYSNRDSAEVIKSIQPQHTHVDPEDIPSVVQESIMPLSTIPTQQQGHYPYSAVCQLYIKYKDAQNRHRASGFATGFFVGPYQVATSAHMLMPKLEPTGEQLWSYSISVYYSFYVPNTDNYKFGVVSIADVDHAANYNENNDTIDDDYAVLTTYGDIGDICSYFKLNPESMDPINQTYRVLGFPGENSTIKQGGETPNVMHDYAGSVSGVTDGHFTFNFNFYEGMSGSPILLVSSGSNYQVFGIGKGYNKINGGYYATRISWAAYDFYNKQIGFKNLSLYQINSVTKSDGVKDFQKYINNNLPMQYLGTKLAVDGGFGPATKTAAIKMLQYWLNKTYGAGLAVDGGFGPATTAAIRSVVFGQTGMGVYILQGLLYGNGYDPKGFDGSFGANGGQGCLNAVKYFQSDNNLAVDGRAGPATLKALCS